MATISVSVMRSRFSFRALMALLLALTLFAAACGGSDDDSSDVAAGDTGGQDDDTSGTTDDDASDDDGGDGDAASSGLSDDTPDEDDPAVSGLADDDSGSSPSGAAAVFCARYAENEALFDEFNLFDPDQVESWLNTSSALLAEAIGEAPSELVPDLQIIQTNFADVASVLEAYGYDFLAAGEEVEELGDDAEATAASDRIDAWIDANCPEAAGDDDATSSLEEDLATPDGLEALFGSEAGRELFVTGMTESGEVTREQAECMIDNLDVELLSALATNADDIDAASAVDLLDVLSACGIDITALSG